jgi:hypothetical protein
MGPVFGAVDKAIIASSEFNLFADIKRMSSAHLSYGGLSSLRI